MFQSERKVLQSFETTLQKWSDLIKEIEGHYGNNGNNDNNDNNDEKDDEKDEYKDNNIIDNVSELIKRRNKFMMMNQKPMMNNKHKVVIASGTMTATAIIMSGALVADSFGDSLAGECCRSCEAVCDGCDDCGGCDIACIIQ